VPPSHNNKTAKFLPPIVLFWLGGDDEICSLDVALRLARTSKQTVRSLQRVNNATIAIQLQARNPQLTANTMQADRHTSQEKRKDVLYWL